MAAFGGDAAYQRVSSATDLHAPWWPTVVAFVLDVGSSMSVYVLPGVASSLCVVPSFLLPILTPIFVVACSYHRAITS